MHKKKDIPPIPKLYEQYYVNKKYEQVELFRILQKTFAIKKGLYPGCFTHITPSFIIPHMVYVDLDTRCQKFFNATTTQAFITSRKEYSEDPLVHFHAADFSKGFDESIASFDLLISLYAGFISKFCHRFLKKDGILLANNSHGDAPLAYLDRRFEFLAVIKRRGCNFRIDSMNLDAYFHTKSGKKIDKKHILATMKGPLYTKTAYAYIFRKK